METEVRAFRAATPVELPAPQVSVVVPFFDEAGNLPALVAELREVLDRLDRPVEVLLVDDGSTDGSVVAARAAVGDDRRFRLLSLHGRFGKSAALAAGRDHSRGGIIVTLDADLQDPPESIPELLAVIDAGSDLAAGRRLDRRCAWHRRLWSLMFNRFLRACSGLDIHDVNCGMKAYRRRVLEAIHMSPGMHRFTPIVAHGHGFRVREVFVPNRPRHAGRTKYGAFRYFEASLGLLGALYVRPSRSPLMSFGALGALLLLAAVAGGAGYALWGTASGTLHVYALLGLGAAGLLGAMLLAVGLVGELILQRCQARRPSQPYVLRPGGDAP